MSRQPTPIQESEPRRRLVMYLTIFALITPVNMLVGGLYLDPSRLLFIVLVPLLLVLLFSGRIGRILPADWFIMLYILWMTLTVFINNPEVAVTYTGSNNLMLLGGYLAARYAIRTQEDFLRMAKLLVIVVICSLPFAFYETITGRMVIPPLVDRIPGVLTVHDVHYPRRMGLDRVQFIFSHPIHYGFFCSIIFGFALWALPRGLWHRLTMAGCTGIACFVSVSSGPVLAIFMQLLLSLWALMFRKVKHGWRILMTSAVVMYIPLEILSDRPAYYAIISKLAFSGHTASVRMTLLEYGVAQVGRTPLLGVGFNGFALPDWMSGSIDNMWLAIALIFGLPAMIFLLLAFITTLVQVGRAEIAAGSAAARIRLAWAFSVIGIMLAMATVAIWGEIFSLVFFTLGSGTWMAHYVVAPESAAEDEGPRDNKRMIYTRFAHRNA